MQYCSLCSIFHVDGADVGPAADLLFATIHNSCCLCNQALPAELYTLTHLRRGGGWEGTRLQGSCKVHEQSNASCFTFQNSQVKYHLQSDVVHNRLLAPGTMHIMPGHVASDTGGTHDARLDSTSEMKSVARQITVRCCGGGMVYWASRLIQTAWGGSPAYGGIGLMVCGMRKLNADLLNSSTQPSEDARLCSAISPCLYCLFVHMLGLRQTRLSSADKVC